MIYKLLFFLLLPIFLFSNELNIKKVEQKLINTNKEKDISKEVENQIEVLNKAVKNVLLKLNKEESFPFKYNKKSLAEKINYLNNKIAVNTKENNSLAIKRDDLKRLLLRENFLYEKTLNSLIKAKQEFKDIKYFQDILNNSISILKNDTLDLYKKDYEKELNNKHSISKAFVLNYIDLYNQNHTQVYVLEHLLNNIKEYRKTNFFIDEFNLQYLVNSIDSVPFVSFISNLTSYYFKFSLGEISVVLFIILFFRLLNKRIISIIANLIAKFFINKKYEEAISIREYLKKSIDTPLIFSLYTLSLQISVYILIDNPNIISKIMPWINTLYMAFFTWALYTILNNSITVYANNLLEKYPNVRKEMIVFILRILKIILILIVVLFLFTQLGLDIKAIAASLGVGGIAVALASKDTLANFFGSLNIMTDNSFSQGDWIRTSELEGTVVDIRMRTTRIRTFDNAMITVPNSQLANTHIMNWSKRKIGRRIKMKIGITYESKIEDIKNLKNDIYEMLNTHPHIASSKNTQNINTKGFEVIKKEDLHGIKRTLLVYIDEFDSSCVNILVYCFSRSPNWEDWLSIKEDVLIKISKLVEKNNCEFAYETQTLHLKKEFTE